MAAFSSTSTFTAGNSNIHYCPDVFLNHRGVDVKKTFAVYLYLRLVAEGLRTFLDQEELQSGYSLPAQIKQALKTARVHFAIFSPRYAESYWCLDELVMLLESKAPIIPVFYGVTPAQVRWKKGEDGEYAQALQKLGEKTDDKGNLRYDSEIIKRWREALSSVANNKGFELEVCNGVVAKQFAVSVRWCGSPFWSLWRTWWLLQWMYGSDVWFIVLVPSSFGSIAMVFLIRFVVQHYQVVCGAILRWWLCG